MEKDITELQPPKPTKHGFAKSAILLIVLSLGLTLATHLIPALSLAIGNNLATVGLETTTITSQKAQQVSQSEQDALQAKLDTALAAVSSLEQEVESATTEAALQTNNLSAQIAVTEELRVELRQAYAAINASGITLLAEKQKNEIIVATLQETIAQNSSELQRLVTTRAATIKTIYSARGRIKRMAASNVGATLGESIPFFGIGVIVAATTYEMTESCAAMDEMTDLLATLDPVEDDPSEDVSHTQVCGLKIPSKEELWISVKSSPTAAWDASKQAVGGVTDWASEMEGPDLSRIEAWFRHVF